MLNKIKTLCEIVDLKYEYIPYERFLSLGLTKRDVRFLCDNKIIKKENKLYNLKRFYLNLYRYALKNDEEILKLCFKRDKNALYFGSLIYESITSKQYDLTLKLLHILYNYGNENNKKEVNFIIYSLNRTTTLSKEYQDYANKLKTSDFKVLEETKKDALINKGRCCFFGNNIDSALSNLSKIYKPTVYERIDLHLIKNASRPLSLAQLISNEEYLLAIEKINDANIKSSNKNRIYTLKVLKEILLVKERKEPYTITGIEEYHDYYKAMDNNDFETAQYLYEEHLDLCHEDKEKSPLYVALKKLNELSMSYEDEDDLVFYVFDNNEVYHK